MRYLEKKDSDNFISNSNNSFLTFPSQSKRVTRSWETQYRLQGPISWRDFHEMAGRGAEENHEPQPIPQLVVGHDRDNLQVSPYSLRYWVSFFFF